MSSAARRRTAWVLALALIAMVGLTAVASVQSYQESLTSLRATRELERAVDETLSLLKDAETGQRGYLLTGQPEFLAPYTEAERALPRQLDRLRSLAGDDPEQRQHLATLAEAVIAKLNELTYTIELYRQHKSEDALGLVREGRGRRLMVAARAEALAMLRAQHALLTQHEQSADARLQRLFVLIGVVWTLAIAAIAAGLWAAVRAVIEARRAAEQLGESERAMRTAAENAGDLVRVLGPNAEPIYVSPSCERILGFTRAEMLAMSPLGLLPEEERDGTFALGQRVLRGEANDVSIVHRLRTKESGYRWFETMLRLVHDQGTATQNIHLISRDITERKAAEDALRQQTERLRLVVDGMGDGVIALATDRRIVLINRPAQQYSALEEGDMFPADWADRHSFKLDGVTPLKAEEAPISLALRGKPQDDVQLMVRDRQERLRTVSVNARPLHGAAGEVIGCVAVLHDITERHRFAQELSESEQRLRILANASFEGVVITSERCILDVNETLVGWTGRSRQQLIGTNALFLFDAEQRSEVVRKSAMADTFETRLLRADGSTRPVEVRATLTTFQSKPVRIAVIRDITERHQREAALRQHTDLLRVLSLRDELTGLYNRRGFAELAEQALRTLARTQQAGCLFFADLDGLKPINDRLGHDAGDRAIRSAASALGAVFRESDVIARLGGDEFAVLALQCGLADVPSVLDRLTSAIAQENSRNGNYVLSMSVGTALFEPPSSLDLNALMDSADHAMYEQKRMSKLRRMA